MNRLSGLPSPKRLAIVAGAVSRSFFELRAFRKLPESRRAASPLPRRFVERLLTLGPLYVKIGQILSTRPDVLPGRYIAELQRLQEHVPPMSLTDVRKVIRDEFHRNDVTTSSLRSTRRRPRRHPSHKSTSRRCEAARR